MTKRRDPFFTEFAKRPEENAEKQRLVTSVFDHRDLPSGLLANNNQQGLNINCDLAWEVVKMNRSLGWHFPERRTKLAVFYLFKLVEGGGLSFGGTVKSPLTDIAFSLLSTEGIQQARAALSAGGMTMTADLSQCVIYDVHPHGDLPSWVEETKLAFIDQAPWGDLVHLGDSCVRTVEKLTRLLFKMAKQDTLFAVFKGYLDMKEMQALAHALRAVNPERGVKMLRQWTRQLVVSAALYRDLHRFFEEESSYGKLMAKAASGDTVQLEEKGEQRDGPKSVDVRNPFRKRLEVSNAARKAARDKAAATRRGIPEVVPPRRGAGSAVVPSSPTPSTQGGEDDGGANNEQPEAGGRPGAVVAVDRNSGTPFTMPSTDERDWRRNVTFGLNVGKEEERLRDVSRRSRHLWSNYRFPGLAPTLTAVDLKDEDLLLAAIGIAAVIKTRPLLYTRLAFQKDATTVWGGLEGVQVPPTRLLFPPKGVQ